MILNFLRTWILLLFMSGVFIYNSVSQNLILNPSFELIDSCPNSDSQLSWAIGWYYVPTFEIIENTPDLIASCAAQFPFPEVSPFDNWTGNQLSYNGLNYAHAIIYANPLYWPYPKVREYM